VSLQHPGDRPAEAKRLPQTGLAAATGESLALAVERSITRAAGWLAAFPETELRFDAAIGLTMIRRHVDNPSLREAYRRARVVADRDHDHPMRRIWEPDHRVPFKAAGGWDPPAPGQSRVNVNRVVAEACFCDVYGLRPETLDYISGPMRDQGGYHTTHGLWALTIAHQRGCVDDARFQSLAARLQREIIDAQPQEIDGAATRDIDLFAERVLMLLISGRRDEQIDRWVRQLLIVQNNDGSWGRLQTGRSPYQEYHATLVATWAMSEWIR